MSIEVTSVFEEFIADPKQRQEFEREALCLEATELIQTLMEREGVSRTELAARLETSKAHVTQLLNGARNMTLRTLADCLFVLGHRAQVDASSLEPLGERRGTSYDIKGRLWTVYSQNSADGALMTTEDELASEGNHSQLVA